MRGKKRKKNLSGLDKWCERGGGTPTRSISPTAALQLLPQPPTTLSPPLFTCNPLSVADIAFASRVVNIAAPPLTPTRPQFFNPGGSDYLFFHLFLFLFPLSFLWYLCAFQYFTLLMSSVSPLHSACTFGAGNFAAFFPFFIELASAKVIVNQPRVPDAHTRTFMRTHLASETGKVYILQFFTPGPPHRWYRIFRLKNQSLIFLLIISIYPIPQPVCKREKRV